ncbi:MAG: hypothetical protein V1837_05885 [Candidatus Woesearchaeota archaeon]
MNAINVISVILAVGVLFLMSGCSAGDRISGVITLQNRTVYSNQQISIQVDLSYNDALKRDEIQEYSINVLVNGNHLWIQKNGQTIGRDNAEVISFGKGRTNHVLNYTIQATTVSGNEYVETVVVFISTIKGVVKTLTSEFITIKAPPVGRG